MKRPRSTKPTSESTPYMDETMAMVYVGDVYSLVVQEVFSDQLKEEQPEKDADIDDGLLPFIR